MGNVSLESLDHKTLYQLLEISRFLGTETSLESLLKMIIHKACEVIESERATIFLYDSQTQELFIHASIDEISVRFSVNEGIAGAAAREGRSVIIEDAYADSRFNAAVDMATGFKTRSILAVPLKDYDGKLVGVLEVINKTMGGFSERDIQVLEILASQTGVVLQRAQMEEIKIQQLKMENEIEMARKIQLRSLPVPPDLGSDISIDVFFKPADHVGGDCYDFIPLPDGSFMILVGDATGHGLGPALISTQTRSLIRGLSSTNLGLRGIANLANQVLVNALPMEKYITLFLGILNPNAMTLRYISAGHEPILLLNGQTGQVVELRRTGLPMGLFPGDHYTDVKQVALEKGSLFAVLTDGVSEFRNPQGEFYGVEGIISCLSRMGDIQARHLMGGLIRDVQVFSQGHVQDDDLTAVIVKCA